MAQRTLDRLLPQAGALLAGVAAFAAGASGAIAAFVMGGAGAAATVSLIFILPLALFAAVVGFAAGSFGAMLLRSRAVTPLIPLTAYRAVLGLSLLIVTIAAGTAGARPVIQHERLHKPRVITDSGEIEKHAGAPASCERRVMAASACGGAAEGSTQAIVWNARELTLSCKGGSVEIADAAGRTIASADVSGFDFVREVLAATLRGPEGREALVLLARLQASDHREMLIVLDADARVIYQELIAREGSPAEGPVSVCTAEESDSLVVALGDPITYHLK